VGIYNDSHNGCSIIVETETVSHPVLRNLSRIKSIVIMCGGKDLGYAPPAYEGQDEAAMVAPAIANAKVFVQNRN
jgi:hypothetical protein